MGRHEGRTGLQPLSDLAGGALPFFRRQEMQGQQTGRCIERTFWRIVDVTLMQTGARGERAQRPHGLFQHFGRRIDAIERPARMSLGKRLQFQPATRAKDEYPSLPRCALAEQDGGHAMQVGEAGHEARRSLGIARHGLGIGERRHQIAHDA
jgi:hypothetical protein